MQQSNEICMFYLRGACRFGSRCWNSHDLAAYRSPKSRAIAAAATKAYYEEGYADGLPSTSTGTSAGTSTSGIPKEVKAQGLQLLIEASMKPILKQSDDSEIEMEKVANDLSVAMKTGNGKSVKETASKLHALHQKKNKESTENENTAWDDVIRCAIDNDLQCNICFEIFIKPTVLNCSHTFCESCIHVWTKRVKKCPICRIHIRSKSYCLTMDSFIEKIVEHLPIEIKHKRAAAIKERNKITIDKPQRVGHRLNGRDLAAILSLEELIEADTPLQFLAMEQNDDISADVIVEESEMFRMNLHDTVVSTRGVNPLMSYIVIPDGETSNRPNNRPHNSSARH